MSGFSQEPSRTDCVLHLSFDYIDGDTVTDLSPQRNDASVNGTVETTTGFDGRGLDFDGATNVDISAELLTVDDDFTVGLWTDVTDAAKTQTLLSLRNDIEFAIEVTETNDLRVYTGTWHTIETNVSGERHIVVTHDADSAETKVYINSNLTTSYVESISTGGQSNTVGEQSMSSIDDVRLYTTVLSSAAVESLYEIGSEHTATQQLRNSWTNAGIPLRGNNLEFGGALTDEAVLVFRQLDSMREARHIDSAAGRQLDSIGNLVGVERRENEGDAKYRARIKGTVIAARSNGTHSDIISATAAILETDITNVEATTDFSQELATAFIRVRFQDVDESELSPTELEQTLQDVVLAGHTVLVVEQPENVFRVRSDQQATSPENGLTSDSISTGGGLTSDL